MEKSKIYLICGILLILLTLCSDYDIICPLIELDICLFRLINNVVTIFYKNIRDYII